MPPVPEGVLEFPLHSLHVRILHQEGRTQLAELTDLDLSRTVLKGRWEQGATFLKSIWQQLTLIYFYI